jgi:hypothetical protein
VRFCSRTVWCHRDRRALRTCLHRRLCPIGFEVAAADPARVRSLTLLNTIVAVETFRRPWVMEPFGHPGVGEAWLKSLRLPGVFVS